MKKLFFALLLFLLSTLAFGKQVPNLVIYKEKNGSSSEYEIYSKDTILAYDANGNVLEIMHFHWNSELEIWEKESKYTITYDKNNNPTNEKAYDWDSGLNDWEEIIKRNLTFDENGNRTGELSYDWDSKANDWEGSNKDTITYDENGNLLTFIDWDWSNSEKEWQYGSKEEYTYENGKISSSIDYNWDEDSKDWEIDYKSEYSYENGDRIDYTHHWNSELSEWEGRWKTIRTYAVNGKIDGKSYNEITYNWNSEQNDYTENNNKFKLIFDENGNELHRELYFWNDSLNGWKGNYKIENTYDENGYELSSIRYDWNDSLNDWEEEYNRKYDITYIELATPIINKIAKNNLLKTSLNNNVLHIELAQSGNNNYSIYNAKGKLIANNNFFGNNTSFDINNLPKGNYFVVVKQGKEKFSNRFIKK